MHFFIFWQFFDFFFVEKDVVTFALGDAGRGGRSRRCTVDYQGSDKPIVERTSPGTTRATTEGEGTGPTRQASRVFLPTIPAGTGSEGDTSTGNP
jgi:hypothetical protein